MKTSTETLSKVIERITNKEILLPDFQRNFVWKEEEKQGKLVASVLAKMPVGSILLLKSDSNDYAYKMIGCKERKTNTELGISGEILALLDGQQRVTVLTNAFSNIVFEMAESAAKLVNQSALKRRFFLRIPKYSDEESSVEDFFNARGLDLPWKDAENDEPNFLADEVYEAIKIVNFNATGSDCFNPFKIPASKKADLVNFCGNGENHEYLVPLYLLTGNNDTWIIQILKRISENIQLDIMERFDSLPNDERPRFVERTLTQDIKDLADHPDRLHERSEFCAELKKQGDNWANALKTYLNSCLNKIQLNQIIVDNHNRARAINIYENLNKGGVPLGTFELIMAKFASVSNENYYEKLVSNIKKKRSYPLIAYSNALNNNDSVKAYIDSDDYIAGVRLGCLDPESEEMASAYIDAYLDVISLYSHCPDFDMDKLNIALVKREKILAVSPEDLKNRCEEVCDALDLAMFFLQMRCGVRRIREINYNLILVVVAYILLNKEYRENEITYDYLEAWYWIVIFSGYFNTDQTDRAVTSIKRMIELLNSGDKTWLKGLEEQIFKAPYFSEKEFILLNKEDGTGILPKDFLRDAICQFFLAVTYKGLFKTSDFLSPFTKLSLEKHHVIPLGSLKYPDEKIKKAEDKLRNNKEYFLNSPINFVYITNEENLIISDDNLESYANRILSYASRSLLGLVGNFETSSEDACKAVLSNRFDDIVGKVQQHIDILLP